jgi:hypothetical protein
MAFMGLSFSYEAFYQARSSFWSINIEPRTSAASGRTSRSASAS